MFHVVFNLLAEIRGLAVGVTLLFLSANLVYIFHSWSVSQCLALIPPEPGSVIPVLSPSLVSLLWRLNLGVDKLLPTGHIQLLPVFICLMSMAAFRLYEQSWKAVIKTIWPTKPKIFVMWPCTENIGHHLPYLNPGSFLRPHFSQLVTTKGSYWHF